VRAWSARSASRLGVAVEVEVGVEVGVGLGVAVEVPSPLSPAGGEGWGEGVAVGGELAVADPCPLSPDGGEGRGEGVAIEVPPLAGGGCGSVTTFTAEGPRDCPLSSMRSRAAVEVKVTARICTRDTVARSPKLIVIVAIPLALLPHDPDVKTLPRIAVL